MNTALELWPVMFVGFWAYPLIAIKRMRQRRLLMDLAVIGSDGPPMSYEEAVATIHALQKNLLLEIAQEALSTSDPAP